MLASTFIYIGMPSKSKGQILHVGAALHVLFALCPLVDLLETEECPKEETTLISNEAIVSAIDFVNVCCQQTAYMAGRHNIGDDIKLNKTCKLVSCECLVSVLLSICG